MTCGKVSRSRVEQVKGVTYSLSRFLGPINWPNVDDKHADSKSSSRDYVKQIISHNKDTELYQAVIYLAPGDYHGFHSPTEWSVVFRRYFPGIIFKIIFKKSQHMRWECHSKLYSLVTMVLVCEI